MKAVNTIWIAMISMFLLVACTSVQKENASEPLTVKAIAAKRMDVEDLLDLNGIVIPEPNASAKVTSVIPGLLTEVHPKVGDWIKKDETVARLQSSLQTAQVAQSAALLRAADANLAKVKHGSRQQEIDASEAAVDVAEATYANAKKAKDRLTSLVHDNIMPGKDLDLAISQEQVALEQMNAAKANYSLVLKGPRQEDRLAAAAQASQAAAALSQAQATLDFTRIASPISGVVAERYLNVGDQAGPATPIFLIVNPKTVLVQANLPVGHNGQVEPGMDAIVEPPDSAQNLTGKVLKVGIKVDPITNALPIQIEVANPKVALKIGMTVKARIVLARHVEAIVIPQKCLISSAASPNRFVVNAIDKGVSIPLEVQPGVLDGEMREVKSGLSEGQLVITNVGYELPAKTPVTVK